MHCVFLLYGIKQNVDFLIKQLECEKFKLPIRKEGEPDKFIWMQGNLRILPFGVYDYAFPKEDMHTVLTGLGFHEESGHASIGFKQKVVLAFMKKALNLEKIPEFESNLSKVWIRDAVSIIPLGVRNDEDVEAADPNLKGWFHEGI